MIQVTWRAYRVEDYLVVLRGTALERDWTAVSAELDAILDSAVSGADAAAPTSASE